MARIIFRGISSSTTVLFDRKESYLIFVPKKYSHFALALRKKKTKWHISVILKSAFSGSFWLHIFQ